MSVNWLQRKYATEGFGVVQFCPCSDRRVFAVQVKLSEVCDKYCLHSVLNSPLGITISCMVHAYMLAYARGLLWGGHLFRGYCVYICV